MAKEKVKQTKQNKKENEMEKLLKSLSKEQREALLNALQGEAKETKVATKEKVVTPTIKDYKSDIKPNAFNEKFESINIDKKVIYFTLRRMSNKRAKENIQEFQKSPSRHNRLIASLLKLYAHEGKLDLNVAFRNHFNRMIKRVAYFNDKNLVVTQDFTPVDIVKEES